MGYNGPKWNQTVEDRRGEYIMQGAAGFSEGLKQGAGAIADMMKQKAASKTESDFLTAQWEKMPGRTPEDDQKFHSGSLGSKRGMVTGVLAQMDEAAKNQPVVPQEGTTSGGGRYLYNPKSGAFQSTRAIDPPPLPTTVENPTPGAPPMGMTGDGDMFNYPKAPEPPPEMTWVQMPDGTMQHHKNGQPTGSMYRIPQKPGMVEIEGAPGTFILTGPDGKPMNDGKMFRKKPGPWAPDQTPFEPVPDAAPPVRPQPPEGWKIVPTANGAFISDGSRMAKWDEEKQAWVPTQLPGDAAAPPPAAAEKPKAVPFWRR